MLMQGNTRNLFTGPILIQKRNFFSFFKALVSFLEEKRKIPEIFVRTKTEELEKNK